MWFVCSEEMSRNKAELDRRGHILRTEGKSLRQNSAEEVERTVAKIEKEAVDALKKMQRKLPSMTRTFQGDASQGGDMRDKMVAYQLGLCQHLDCAMEQDMEKLSQQTLATRYESVREQLIGEFSVLCLLLFCFFLFFCWFVVVVVFPSVSGI